MKERILGYRECNGDRVGILDKLRCKYDVKIFFIRGWGGDRMVKIKGKDC